MRQPVGRNNMLKKTGVLKTTIEQHDMSLCFYTKNIYFDIYYNGAMIYSFYQDVPTIFGKAYGVYMHHIEIPSYDPCCHFGFCYLHSDSNC